ncbi:LOW QUALITY PROTEIN: uncharacterized protein LOC128071316 [Budorcas taxicolor]|uniref:LOW QUALITY PROTEIN: uncharacterized protein LOC128071316 n=1 Tax=Budorcas taxicolor TaxID=37181 RepID=UPI0022852693|nr:LOW QUALITY PROTEIN: uncharacterized protein LOC128071316 [Budorcas taxicolor]
MKNSMKSSEKLDRKTVERNRNRRIHMKTLCLRLTSLIPRQHFKPSKDLLSLPDQLAQAGTYITQLKERVEELQRRKQEALSNIGAIGSTENSPMSSITYPLFELRDLGSRLEIVLVTGMKKKFMLYEVISILTEEGAEVVNASVSTIGAKVFHTLHAQVKVSRVGVDTSGFARDCRS